MVKQSNFTPTTKDHQNHYLKRNWADQHFNGQLTGWRDRFAQYDCFVPCAARNNLKFTGYSGMLAAGNASNEKTCGQQLVNGIPLKLFKFFYKYGQILNGNRNFRSNDQSRKHGFNDDSKIDQWKWAAEVTNSEAKSINFKRERAWLNKILDTKFNPSQNYLNFKLQVLLWKKMPHTITITREPKKANGHWTITTGNEKNSEALRLVHKQGRLTKLGNLQFNNDRKLNKKVGLHEGRTRKTDRS